MKQETFPLPTDVNATLDCEPIGGLQVKLEYEFASAEDDTENALSTLNLDEFLSDTFCLEDCIESENVEDFLSTDNLISNLNNASVLSEQNKMQENSNEHYDNSIQRQGNYDHSVQRQEHYNNSVQNGYEVYPVESFFPMEYEINEFGELFCFSAGASF